jgi:hypothetical protein
MNLSSQQQAEREQQLQDARDGLEVQGTTLWVTRLALVALDVERHALEAGAPTPKQQMVVENPF